MPAHLMALMLLYKIYFETVLSFTSGCEGLMARTSDWALLGKVTIEQLQHMADPSTEHKLLIVQNPKVKITIFLH